MKKSLLRALLLAAVAGLLPACGSGGSGGGGGDGGDDQAPPGSAGWTPDAGNPTLPISSTAWDSFGVFYPSVVHPAPTSYLMWYEGYRELFVGGGSTSPSPSGPSQDVIIVGPIYIRAIGLATSSDGLAWTKSGTTPVLSGGAAGAWDSGGVGTPCLLASGPTDRMWYTGWGSPTMAIGLATFDSGTSTWTNSAAPVLSAGAGPAWDASGVTSPCVLFDGTTYRMWYVAAPTEQDPGVGIGTAESSDGVTWTKSLSNPVLVPGSPGAPDQDGVGSAWVVQDGSTWRMWYTGWKGGIPTVCYASSPDGLNWIKYSGNPILSAGPAGAWNSHGMKTPCVLLEGSLFRMWMAGIDDVLEPQIGYASNP